MGDVGRNYLNFIKVISQVFKQISEKSGRMTKLQEFINSKICANLSHGLFVVSYVVLLQISVKFCFWAELHMGAEGGGFLPPQWKARLNQDFCSKHLSPFIGRSHSTYMKLNIGLNQQGVRPFKGLTILVMIYCNSPNYTMSCKFVPFWTLPNRIDSSWSYHNFVGLSFEEKYVAGIENVKQSHFQ